MARLDLDKLLIFIGAFLAGHPAAGSEAAARFGIHRAGHISLQHDTGIFGCGVYTRNRGEQRYGIGVHGICEDIVCIGHFHDLPQIHYGDAVRYMPHNAQVVRNEQI
jgi:hypothetical protein